MTDSGVAKAAAYLAGQGMKGSVYSAMPLLHGLYNRAAHLDGGVAALELLTQCSNQSWCNMLQQHACNSA